MNSPTTDHELIADEASSISWRDAMDALRLYRDKRGSADVAPRVRARGIALGKWGARCRDDYWHGVLSIEHSRDLEAVDGWSWGPVRAGTWRHAFDLLSDFVTRTGEAVLIDATTFDRVDLQAWMSAQRQAYSDHRLSDTGIQLLEQLPGWDWDADTARWTQGLAAARLHIGRKGSLGDVTRETRVGKFRLGHWVQRCREDYRAGTMPADRSAELETLAGWSWQPALQSWNDGRQALQRFISQAGHASPTQHVVIDGFPVGWWVTKRRRDYRLGALSAERITELEALPGWVWDPLKHRWQQGLAALSEYASVNGHANPARGERFNDYPVGDWAWTQRTSFARGRLPVGRIPALEALPGWRWGKGSAN